MALATLMSVTMVGPIVANSAQERPGGRPNVLMILTDDQGYGDLSLHGNPFIRTPHLDRLGEESVRFDRFYVSSVCAPTRAALLTGRYPVRAGTHGVTHNRETMRPGEVTFGHAFRSAGYRTAYIGKWHNGLQYPNTPEGMGFDWFLGFFGGHINDYFDPVLLRGTRDEPTTGYVTDVLTDDALRFMSESRDSPFLLYLNYNAPHDPYQVPDVYYDRMAAQGLEPRAAAHFAMVENLDDNIGRLLEQLDQIGLTERTVVLFLTDNGAASAAARHFNAGMRGWKTSTHEGGTRVPLFMRYPAAEWPARVEESITAHIDLYPTLLDICGIDPPTGPPLDGISLRPLLENKGDTWPERILFTHNAIDETNRYPGAARTQRYRLVCRIDGPQAGSQAGNRDHTRTDWELYDMENDPGEASDLAAERPELVADLAARYEAWLDEVSAEGLQRWPLPVGHDQHNPVRLQAAQAYIKKPVGYQVGGFAFDWLTDWTSTAGRIWFDIDVVRTGDYVVQLRYTCPPEAAGSMLVVNAGSSSLTATVPPAPPVEIDLPHRDDSERYRMRQWTDWEVGVLHLTEGRQTLSLDAKTIPGESVLDFKHLRLERKEQPL